MDDLSSGQFSNIPNNNIIFINKKVQELNESNLLDINGIFHLAAQASVPVSIDDFYSSSSNNLLSSIRVFDWANQLGIPIVYASSSAVYGNLPLGDDHIDKYDILSPYAQDKLTLEHYAKMSCDVFETPSLGLRFFNVYGPRQDPTNPYSGVISIFIDRLLKNLPVTINGGHQTRDFVYVKDIANILLQSMDSLLVGNKCDTLNVGTGVSVTINDLLDILSEILKIKPKKIIKDLPKGDPVQSSGTFEKIKKILSIEVNDMVNLEYGLRKTIEFIKGDQHL